MFETWFLTVFVCRERRWAISLLESPSSISRGVSRFAQGQAGVAGGLPPLAGERGHATGLGLLPRRAGHTTSPRATPRAAATSSSAEPDVVT